MTENFKVPFTVDDAWKSSKIHCYLMESSSKPEVAYIDKSPKEMSADLTTLIERINKDAEIAVGLGAREDNGQITLYLSKYEYYIMQMEVAYYRDFRNSMGNNTLSYITHYGRVYLKLEGT